MKLENKRYFRKKCQVCKSKLIFNGEDFIFVKEPRSNFYGSIINFLVIKIECPVCGSLIKAKNKKIKEDL